MPLAVCATPIGNLADVTLRVLEELAAADTVLCEDTRHTRILLERHGIEARLLSYHQHNEATRLVDLIPRLDAGERIALVSDAGLPGVNDPGATAGRRRDRRGGRGHGPAGAVSRRDRVGRERPRRRAVPVRRATSLGARRTGRRSGRSCRRGRIRRSRSNRRSGCPQLWRASRWRIPAGMSRSAAS